MVMRASGAVLAMLPLVVLGGCATVPSASRDTYYRVPCTTPGAIVAQPIAGGPEDVGGPTPPPQAVAPAAEPQAGVSPPVSAPPSCVIAVNEAGYGRGYYPWGGYRRPYYGSFGVGIGIGSFGHGYRGGHFGGGHHGGGRGGGHH